MLGDAVTHLPARAPAGALPAPADTASERDLFWELATDLFAVCDADGTIRSVNPAWQRLLGWAAADVVGRDIFALAHPDDAASARSQALDAWARRGRLALIETRLRHARGGHVPISWSAYADGERWYLVGADVTEEQSARRELESALRFNHSTLDSLDARVAVLDAEGRILAVNRAWSELADRERAERAGPGDSYLDACASEPGAAAGFSDLFAGRTQRFEYAYSCFAGDEERFFDLRAVRTEDRGTVRVVVQHHDVTERVRSERALHLSGGLLNQVSAAVVATGLDGAIVSWNDGASAMFGWTAEEAVGRDIADLIVPPGQRGRRRDVLARLCADGHYEDELTLTRKDASTFVAATRSAVYYDAAGVPAGLIGVAFDITDKVESERDLRTARDHLRAVTDSMGEGLLTLDREGRFTYVNAAAERLLGWPLEELRGRRMHETIYGASNTGEVAETPHDVFFRRDGRTVPVACVSAPLLGTEDRGGAVVVFSDITEKLAGQRGLHEQMAELAMLDDIRHALEEDRFVLHGQPIVDLATGRTAHHEMLLRMVDRNGELVLPGRFLPVAERHGVIIDIDHWVLRSALAIAASGRPVAINLSAHSFADPGLTRRFADLMHDSGADPADVIIELTETALVQSDAAAALFVQTASTLGVRIALDDFGTGYGSFSYLKHLELHCLKIDIEFVCDVATNPASQRVTEAVVGLARGFGLKTVAEGVEDASTLGLLASLGVDYVQGHALGMPAPL